MMLLLSIHQNQFYFNMKPSPKETKQAIKEALTEWLEDKFSEFGKLSLKAILALLVAGLVYFWAASQGWKI